MNKPSSLKGPNVITPLPGPKALEIIERHKRAIVTTTMVEYPMVGEEAEGFFVKDVDGNVFLDFASSVASLPLGHCHPEVVEVIRAQVGRLMHFAGNDFYNPIQVDLAEKLIRITPGDFSKKVFFANSGTEACEAALKLARRHTKRPKAISFIGAFHGRTLGSLSLTFSKTVQRKYYEPLPSGVMYTPYAYCYRCIFNLEFPGCGWRCVHFIDEVLFVHVCDPSEVAVLFVEPIQGEGGYVVPPIGFLRELRKLCDAYGILMVCDEVQTGLGRTGKMFACEHDGVAPDVMALAKSLGGGLSLGSMITRADVADWEPGAHSNTFGGNPVMCIASLKTIEIIERDRLIDNAMKMGGYMFKRLNEMKDDHDIIGDVRGRGLMIGVEFVKDKKTKEPFPEVISDITVEAHKNGLILLPCGRNAIRLVPPLTVTEEIADVGLEIFERAIFKVGKDRRPR